jgi:hypothetical protein
LPGLVYRCHPFGLVTSQADGRQFAVSPRTATSCQELSAIDYRKWKLWGKQRGTYAWAPSSPSAIGCAAGPAHVPNLGRVRRSAAEARGLALGVPRCLSEAKTIQCRLVTAVQQQLPGEALCAPIRGKSRGS